MPNKYDILRSQDNGFFQNLMLQGKLILRLLSDPRVSTFLKILPIAALIYLVSPIDLFPGLVLPVVGVIDDAMVIWLGATLFVNLCPEDVVREHMNELQKVITGTSRDVPNVDQGDEIVEVEAREVSDNGQ